MLSGPVTGVTSSVPTMTRGRHRRREYSPFECEWVTIKVVKPVNNIDSIAKMAAVFIGFLVFCLIIAAIFIF